MIDAGLSLMNGNENKQIVKSLEEGLGISGLFAHILVSRGISTPGEAELFLYPRLDDLSDPFLLPDVIQGIERLVKAFKTQERVCLFGDYDADGVTSVALMVNFLRQVGMDYSTCLPKREEGYGLNMKAVETIKKGGSSLIVCLDCGSTNIQEINFAGELGIDVIVIDHHEPGPQFPPVSAFVNPKRDDSLFPTRELAACGVTFFFLWALRRVFHERGLLKKMINLKRELDLVCLGTMGDMVPLTKDNRILTRFGMENMKKRPRTWLKSFFRKGIIPRRVIDEYSMNFIIVPRINATGRIGDPALSLDFLICEDEFMSENILNEINDTNNRRQRVGETILREAVEIVTRGGYEDKNSIVLFKKDWHIGVVGIVAQKLVEIFEKPSIVITEVNGLWKGSGRGGEGVNLYEILTNLSPLLLKFGGHKYACGVSLEEGSLVSFREAFERSTVGAAGKRKRQIAIDAVAGFDELSGDLASSIELLSPFGVGNPRPNLLLTQASLTKTNNNRVRIIDKKRRTWYGYLQGKMDVPQTENLSIVASPIIKEERGGSFIHLAIKGFSEDHP